MNRQVSSLLELQKINDQIAEHRRWIEALKLSVKNKHDELAESHKKIEEIKAEIFKNKKEEDRRGLDLKSNEDDIKKLLLQLNQTRSNDEYSALHKRIKEERRQDSDLEDEILKLMTQNDELKSQTAGINARLKVLEGELAQAEREASEQIARHEADISLLQAQGKQFEVTIDPGVLDKYRRVFTRNEGSAMAAADRIGLICRGCNMSITRQQINEILKDDGVVFCKSCNRILYLEET